MFEREILHNETRTYRDTAIEIMVRETHLGIFADRTVTTWVKDNPDDGPMLGKLKYHERIAAESTEETAERQLRKIKHAVDERLDGPDVESVTSEVFDDDG